MKNSLDPSLTKEGRTIEQGKSQVPLFTKEGLGKLGRWPFIIFFVALVLRLVYLLQIQHTPLTDFLLVDSKFYHEWAKSIAAGDWLGGTRTFVMAPLYAYFLALVYSITGPVFQNALVLQILIGSLSCVLGFYVTKKYFGTQAAIIAGICCAVYPVFIFYDGTLLKENLMVFVSLLFLFLYPVEPVRSPEPGARINGNRLIICGMLLGLNALMRPTILLMPPLIVALEYPQLRRLAFKRLAWLVLGIGVIIAPVAMRNKYVGGEWVVTVASGGMNFWTGNNPAAHGAYNGAPFLTSEEPQFEDEDFRKEASRRSGRELTESQASDYWYGQGVRFLVNNPGRAVWLLWRKTLGFWHTVELPSDLNYYFARDFSPLLRLDLLSFGIFAPLGIMGMVLAWRKYPASRLLTLFVAANFLASLIFFNSSRYRLPVVPVVTIFAAFFIMHVYDTFFVRRQNLSVELDLKLFAPLIALLVLCNYHDTMLNAIARTRLSYRNASAIYLNAGNVQRAADMAQRAVAIDPAYALGWQQYSNALLRLGRTDEAKAAFERAAALDSVHRDARFERSLPKTGQEQFEALLKQYPGKEKEIHNNLGLMYLKRGEFDAAEKEFRSAIAIDSRYEKAYYNLGLVFERRKDTAQARAYYEKALAIDPNYEKAKTKLGRQ